MHPGKLALGLMSGTSADGVSLALIQVRGGVRVLSHATYPYSAALRRRILAAPSASVQEISRLHFELGRVFAQAAVKFLGARRIALRRLVVAGSHGHTIVHLPEEATPSTIQIGEASFLAEALKVPVVCDFRPRDMAAGGQGAPLIPFFDQVLFGAGPPRALQNIGGIANVSLVGRGIKALGFDTGPGNSLIDLAVRRISRGRRDFDRDGAMAYRGKVDEVLARRLLREPFFLKRPPKSLDRLAFAESYLRRRFSQRLKAEDLVATLTFFTALTIAYAYQRFLPLGRLKDVVVSGGGSLNPALMVHLKRLLAPLKVRNISEFGIAPLAKEPAAMALMALYAIQRRSNHCFSATGARGPRILGKILPVSPYE